MIRPSEAQPILQALAPAFTKPTSRRFLVLLGAAILTTGRRTVANLLRTAAPLADGHPTTYPRQLTGPHALSLCPSCYPCRPSASFAKRIR
jgi:hypothetical protein